MLSQYDQAPTSDAVEPNMTEAMSDQPKKQAIPEIVRSRITHLQERLGELETEARSRVSRALTSGNASLRELDRVLERVSPDDWTVPGVRRQLDTLRARAESFRASALKRVGKLPGTAVSKLASGARAPIQNLTSGLDEIAKRIEGRSDGVNGEKVKTGDAK
jgi:hypothetical protein